MAGTSPLLLAPIGEQGSGMGTGGLGDHTALWA